MNLPKRALLLLITTAFLAGCADRKLNPSPGADSFAASNKAYKAVYQVPRGNLFAEERIWSNGNGLYRMEMESNQALLPSTMVNLLDMNTKRTTVWTEGKNSQKVYAQGPNPPIDPLRMMVAPDSFPRGSEIQSLGNKLIDGHKCHGWKSSSFGSESWIDDDYGCIVQGTAGSSTEPMKMTSWSTATPDPSLFKPPADYVAASSRN